MEGGQKLRDNKTICEKQRPTGRIPTSLVLDQIKTKINNLIIKKKERISQMYWSCTLQYYATMLYATTKNWKFELGGTATKAIVWSEVTHSVWFMS